ncbi:hypothetical protein BDA99DRAFT_262369 [Phascolomyces articulosus]|uniref:Uncharacterized protein n=1 Tax=Phascolomyces articulosus TaxID=60185 RepID=A0AAD5P8H4_9FUNG|nr:hypothetical protein BDA99DRAFT_262369 [Phascolomyces articulosus]
MPTLIFSYFSTPNHSCKAIISRLFTFLITNCFFYLFLLYQIVCFMLLSMFFLRGKKKRAEEDRTYKYSIKGERPSSIMVF